MKRETGKPATIDAGPKGNLRFSLDEPIPYGLIAKIAKIVESRFREGGG